MCLVFKKIQNTEAAGIYIFIKTKIYYKIVNKKQEEKSKK